MKKRHDAWTHEEDQFLADTVLSHIREGNTRTAAFEIAAQKLARTATACGYRWNSAVKKRFEKDSSQEILLLPAPAEIELTMESCINYLRALHELQEENEKLKSKNKMLINTHTLLTTQYNNITKELNNMKEHYRNFFDIIEQEAIIH